MSTSPRYALKKKPMDVFLHNGLGLIDLLIGFVIIFPLLYAFFSSFKSASDMHTYPPKLLPAQWTTENYASVFTLAPFSAICSTPPLLPCSARFSG